MKYRKVLNVLLFPASVFLVSCHKKSNSNPFGNSRIATITETHADGGYNYRITYDTYNNVDSIIMTGFGTDLGTTSFKAFNYVGSSYVITDPTGAYTVYANTSGQILKVLVLDTLTMLYNGSQLGELDTWAPQAAYPYFSITKEHFTWANGDLTRDSTGGPAYTYDYDNSKAGQPGDAWRMLQLLQFGRPYVKTSHLVTDKMFGSAWVEKYLYTTDGSGRVTQFTWVGNGNGTTPNDTVVYSYTYY